MSFPGVRLLPAGLALFTLLCLPFGRAQGDQARPRSGDALGTGNHVPALRFSDLEGRSREIAWSGEGAAATLFFFFDLRSAPGILGMTFLDRLYRKAADFGLDIVAVEASGLDRAGISDALERYLAMYSPPPFPVIPDSDGRLKGVFGVFDLPSIYIAERHGVIHFHRKGFDERTEALVAARIRQTLHIPDGVLDEAPEVTVPDAPPEEPESGARPLLFPGDRVPHLDFTDLDGHPRALDWSPEGGELTILFFWGDPCRPCIQEMLFLDHLAGKARDLDLALKVLAVAGGGLDAAGARAVMERYKTLYTPPSFPIVLDSVSRLSDTFGRGELPATFLIEGSGTLLSVTEGFDRQTAEEWIGSIERELPRALGALDSLLE